MSPRDSLAASFALLLLHDHSPVASSGSTEGGIWDAKSRKRPLCRCIVANSARQSPVGQKRAQWCEYARHVVAIAVRS
eukprot:CAMPEP_0206133046 /NCGR_PEP_ID=MMETSP1472-20131121/51786_1 /ASSEMBLY_ACC=CAM_ASM_001108 /TAXON_ID=41880 /ORGANISM="Pycnococcus provasolii, Strain RCC251" /LENGTH=77 /DNA_ID=CAMNT_0053524585 /DNA_START=179 /DNA_END=409 /DNA_ORIENTATION=+